MPKRRELYQLLARWRHRRRRCQQRDRGCGIAGGSITSTGSISLPTVVTAGSYAKVITDAYGRVTGSTALLAADIPALAASAISSGTLALATMPSLPASTISSGTLNVAQVPNLAGTYVPLTGVTMTGALAVPANGLVAGTNQLVLSGGNVGIGTAVSLNTLDLKGNLALPWLLLLLEARR